MGNFFSIAVVLFGLFGWVMNIVQLSQYDHFTGMAIVRAMGILLAPLGAVLGYL